MNAGRDVWLRATLLAQLAERIRTLLETWRQSNEPEDARTTLGTLSAELATPTTNPTEVEHRWQQAVSTLETLIGAPASTRRRKAFWKR